MAVLTQAEQDTVECESGTQAVTEVPLVAARYHRDIWEPHLWRMQPVERDVCRPEPCLPGAQVVTLWIVARH